MLEDNTITLILFLTPTLTLTPTRTLTWRAGDRGGSPSDISSVALHNARLVLQAQIATVDGSLDYGSPTNVVRVLGETTPVLVSPAKQGMHTAILGSPVNMNLNPLGLSHLGSPRIGQNPLGPSLERTFGPSLESSARKYQVGEKTPRGETEASAGPETNDRVDRKGVQGHGSAEEGVNEDVEQTLRGIRVSVGSCIGVKTSSGSSMTKM